ncbi:hypothetical protein [Kaarinaea lacus]
MDIKFFTAVIIIAVGLVITGCDNDQAQSNPVAQTSAEQSAPAKPITITEVESRGARKLGANEIKSLIVGKMISIKRLSTGDEITGYYNEDGTRTLIEFSKGVAIQGGNTTGATRDPYSIDNDQLHAVLEGKQISTTIYQLGERYLAAINDEGGVVNYEVFPPGKN